MGAVAALMAGAPAGADTLQQALEEAYRRNPTLTAQRAQVRAADENVPIARAAGRPTLEGTATYQENVLKGRLPPTGFFSNPDRQFVGQLNGTYPLLTFGAVRGAVRAAEARVDASQAGLRGTEADLFTAVVSAYMDVIRDEAVVRLNQRNSEVIGFNLTEVRDRFKAGNRGPVDVAQSEARVSLATSQYETAQARLISSRENYIRLVGHAPGELAPPPPLPSLPARPDDAVVVALRNNPNVLAARANRSAAAYDVDIANAELKPRLNAQAGLFRYDYLGSLAPGTGPRNGDQGTTANVGLTLRVPFYSGGRLSAQYRQARERQGVATEQVTEAERTVVAQARSAHATWAASMRVIAAAQGGTLANGRALEGLKAQTDAGLLPLLDRLNAEQELLNAQVTLVTAERDAYVAGFALLASMGRAEAKDLNFATGALYDPVTHYDAVRNRLAEWNRIPAPEPVATGTGDVPAQDAVVAAR